MKHHEERLQIGNLTPFMGERMSEQGETLLVSSSPVLRLAEPDPVSTFGYLLRYCISEYVDKDERIEELAFLFLGFAASFMTTYILSHFGILA
jgi:hypothetical protein